MLVIVEVVRGTDRDLDLLSRPLTQKERVLLLDVLDDRVVQLVTRDPDGLGGDDAAEEMTATSVVPPPMSTTMLPVASWTGRPEPMAAAMGSSMMCTWRAPAWDDASMTARRSTPVMPEGTHTTTRGLARYRRLWIFRMK